MGIPQSQLYQPRATQLDYKYLVIPGGFFLGLYVLIAFLFNYSLFLIRELGIIFSILALAKPMLAQYVWVNDREICMEEGYKGCISKYIIFWQNIQKIHIADNKLILSGIDSYKKEITVVISSNPFSNIDIVTLKRDIVYKLSIKENIENMPPLSTYPQNISICRKIIPWLVIAAVAILWWIILQYVLLPICYHYSINIILFIVAYGIISGIIFMFIVYFHNKRLTKIMAKKYGWESMGWYVIKKE